MKKHYIMAVTELLLQGKEVSLVLANLQKTLTEKGYMSIYGAILKGVAKQLQLTEKNASSRVIVANEAHVAKLKEAISASLSQLGGTLMEASIETDPTLIGGYIALHEGKSINRSYKEKLVSLYRTITS